MKAPSNISYIVQGRKLDQTWKNMFFLLPELDAKHINIRRYLQFISLPTTNIFKLSFFHVINHCNVHSLIIWNPFIFYIIKWTQRSIFKRNVQINAKKKIQQKNQPKKTRGSAKTFLTCSSPLNNEKPILSLNN